MESASAPVKGASVFLDVFRRADKNDDGALSWDEFKNFFADGILSEDELKQLFNQIDTHNTNNIDTGELCTYFTQHLEQFSEVFPAIEELNGAINKALLGCHKEYSTKPLYEQFCTRFFLREVCTQISALEQPLETACEALDSEAKASREDTNPIQAEASSPRQEVDATSTLGPNPDVIMPGRYARRAKQFSTQTSINEGGHNVLNQQLERLKVLVDKLENKVKFDPVEEEVVTSNDPMNLLVHRRFVCAPDADKAFRNSVRTYVEGTAGDVSCSHINVRAQAGSNLYNIYEIWASENDWKSHMKSDTSKAFQHANIDNLELPEQIKTLVVPGKWCARE